MKTQTCVALSYSLFSLQVSPALGQPSQLGLLNTPTASLQSGPIYPTPPLGQDMTQGQFLKRSLTGLNSEFSFS